MAQKGRRASGRPRQGRPARAPETVRSNRVVTFVTDAELEQLEDIAWREERSLSAVVYRVLSAYLKREGERRHAKSSRRR